MELKMAHLLEYTKAWIGDGNVELLAVPLKPKNRGGLML